MAIKSNVELEEIRIQREAASKRLESLKKREIEIYHNMSSADIIVADETLMKGDIRPDEVNYVLGQSAGFIAGFQAAINEIVDALSNEYRDIPMTESELYMLVELGKSKERAWLKDYKQKQIIEKAGWTFDFTNRCSVWVKKCDDKEKEQNNG